MPARIIKRYILDWLAADPDRTMELCEFYTGINVRTLSAIVHDDRESVRFDTADSILIRLGHIMAWRDDPELTEYYDMVA